jgi:hypothetical protein
MKTTKSIFGILTITAALAVQVQAQSTLTWDWTLTGLSLTGNGTLTTEATISSVLADPSIPELGTYNGYLITDISGTLNGNSVTGLAAQGSVNNNDNLILVSAPAIDLPESQYIPYISFPQVDPNGIAFYTSDGDLWSVILSPYQDNPTGLDGVWNANSGWLLTLNDNDHFSATIEPVPEPSTLALFTMGALMLYRLRKG